MWITREIVAARKAVLLDVLAKVENELQQIERRHEQVRNNGNAIRGAIQLCDEFLAVPDAVPAEEIESK